MRLSNEAKNYVESLYSQKMDEVSKNLQNDLGHIRASFDKSPTSVKYHKLNQVSAEKFRELVMTRAQAYIKAYELDGRLLDEAEVREITAELTQIADVQVGHALVAIGYESQFLDPWQPKAQKWAISISNLEAKPKRSPDPQWQHIQNQGHVRMRSILN